jgi:Flp pilus assembly CpaF family ATPase
MATHVKRVHFAIPLTNKRNYTTLETQRLVQKIAEISGKTINEDQPLKKSTNSAFSSLPQKRVPLFDDRQQLQQRQLGRASLDLSHCQYYYNANFAQVSTQC